MKEIREQYQMVNLTEILVNQKAIFNVDDLSVYSGLSKSFIYKLTQSRKIKFSCPSGKLIFFRKEDVDQFLLSNPISTADDIEQAAIDYENIQFLKGGRRG